jgi:hypothetical protein
MRQTPSGTPAGTRTSTSLGLFSRTLLRSAVTADSCRLSVRNSAQPRTWSHPSVPKSAWPADMSRPSVPKSAWPADRSHPPVPKSAWPVDRSHPPVPKSAWPVDRSHPSVPKSAWHADRSHSPVPKSACLADSCRPPVRNSACLADPCRLSVRNSARLPDSCRVSNRDSDCIALSYLSSIVKQAAKQRDSARGAYGRGCPRRQGIFTALFMSFFAPFAFFAVLSPKLLQSPASFAVSYRFPTKKAALRAAPFLIANCA